MAFRLPASADVLLDDLELVIARELAGDELAGHGDRQVRDGLLKLGDRSTLLALDRLARLDDQLVGLRQCLGLCLGARRLGRLLGLLQDRAGLLAGLGHRALVLVEQPLGLDLGGLGALQRLANRDARSSSMAVIGGHTNLDATNKMMRNETRAGMSSDIFGMSSSTPGTSDSA